MGQYKFLKDMLEVNFFGQLRSILKLKSMLDKSKHPTLVLFTSTAGWSSQEGWSQYNISKTLINSLITNLGSETQNSNFKVFGINPWEARTKMNTGSHYDPTHIIPLIQSILFLRDEYQSGSIFTPDGNNNIFLNSDIEIKNIFSLMKTNFNLSLDYTRNNYLIGGDSAEKN